MDQDAPVPTSPKTPRDPDVAFDDLVFDIAFAMRHRLPASRRDVKSADNAEYLARRVAEMLQRRFRLDRKEPPPLHSTPDMKG